VIREGVDHVDDHRPTLPGILSGSVAGDAEGHPRSLKFNEASNLSQPVFAIPVICGLAANRNQESACRTVIEGESYAAIDRRSADTPDQCPGISDR
jgi:hypothetical protein